MGGVGDHRLRLPTGRQFSCCDEAYDVVLIWRPGECVAVLAVDLYWHDDGDQKLFGDERPEQAGHFRLTCREDPLHSFRNRRLWQDLAVGHPGIDELLHVAVDEHDGAAPTQGQRGLGLLLELGEIPWRSDGEAANACSLSISPMM